MHEMCTAANSHSNGSGISNTTNNNNINDHTWNLLFTCCVPLPTAVSCAFFPLSSLTISSQDGFVVFAAPSVAIWLRTIFFHVSLSVSIFFSVWPFRRHEAQTQHCDISSGHHCNEWLRNAMTKYAEARMWLPFEKSRVNEMTEQTE